MQIKTQAAVYSFLTVAALGAAVSAVWYSTNKAMSAQQDELVTSQAVAIGVNTSEQVAATRSVYTGSVVGSLKPHGVAFNRAPESGQAPLPAVLISRIAQHLKTAGGNNSVSFALRSGWNINGEQGIKTEFETDGWADLQRQHEQLQKVPVAERMARLNPFYRRTVLEDGRPAMLVMTADLASAESCVTCHNQLEQTAEIRAMRGTAPVKQFQLGDLMGAVVTTVPLAKAEAIAAGLKATQANASRDIWLAMAFGLTVAVGTGVLFGRRLSNRILAVSGRLQSIAEGEGDLTQRLDVSVRDEVGTLAGNFNHFVENIQQTVIGIRSRAQAINGSSAALAAISDELAAGASETNQQSAIVAAAAVEVSTSMSQVSEKANEVSSGVQSATAAVEQMSGSIREVVRHAELTASTVDRASGLAKSSASTMDELNVAAQEIGRVVELIQDIAEQTNLLALNATIEAARAGDAGRGFAIVAGEVKQLASQTSGATSDIQRRVDAIQNSSALTVRSIEGFGSVINELNNSFRSISAAVEQQQQATDSISENMSKTNTAVALVAGSVRESAAATLEITRNMTAVDTNARRSSEGAAKTRDTGTALVDLTEELQDLVARFKV